MGQFFQSGGGGSFAYSDINGQTEDTAPAIGDFVPTADVSASALKKVSLENLYKIINGLTAETAVAMSTDLVPIYDASASAPRKMTIDNLLGGVRPFVYANRNSAQSISNNTWTKVECNSEITDTNGNYDPSTNYRFTCTIPGIYLTLGCVNFASGVDTALSAAAIRKDGGGIAQTFIHQSTNKTTGAITAHIASYSATQYAELWALQDTGGSVNVGNNGENTWFCVARLA